MTRDSQPEIIPEPLNTSKASAFTPTTPSGDPVCLTLSCAPGSYYVGSKNSDKYYSCSCHYASRIKPENIVCFKTEKEAESEGRERSEC